VKNIPVWQYDEMKQVGRDYSDPVEVNKYDLRHRNFMDFDKECEKILDFIQVEKDFQILDMGCGTGNFAVRAARKCGIVHAVDVSRTMLDAAKEKAAKCGLNNIRFHHGAFLSYEHSGEALDAVVSQVALHHLPDFWKSVALKKMAGILKDGARLFLMDVVYSFDIDEYRTSLENFLKEVSERVDEKFADEFAEHIREEYSTESWIMEGILERAGFIIESREYRSLMATYQCRKK
jgi:putative AdoMet-dependent methyltransferase